MRIYPWCKLPACLSRQIRKLEAYTTAGNPPPLAYGMEKEWRNGSRVLFDGESLYFYFLGDPKPRHPEESEKQHQQAWFKFVAAGRKPAGVSPRIPCKTGRLAPFRYGLLPGFEPCPVSYS